MNESLIFETAVLDITLHTAPIDDISMQIDSPPTLLSNSALLMNAVLLFETAVLEDTSSIFCPPIGGMPFVPSTTPSSMCNKSSHTSTQITESFVSRNSSVQLGIDTKNNATNSSINEMYVLATKAELLENVTTWMNSIDGGRHPDEICYKA